MKINKSYGQNQASFPVRGPEMRDGKVRPGLEYSYKT